MYYVLRVIGVFFCVVVVLYWLHIQKVSLVRFVGNSHDSLTYSSDKIGP